MYNYFNLNEFIKNCSQEERGEFYASRKCLRNVYYFLPILNELRRVLNTAVYINSCYRSPSHNEFVGGVPTSQHLDASAVDISFGQAHGYFAKEAVDILIERMSFDYLEGGIRQIIIYDSFIHVGLWTPEHKNKPTRQCFYK